MRFGVFNALLTRISLLAFEYYKNDGCGLRNVGNIPQHGITKFVLNFCPKYERGENTR